MQDEIDVGEGPAEESCAQVGDRDYTRNARTECQAYIEAIRKVCGRDPEGARLKVKSNPHDYGSYLSVVVRFDSENQAAVDYAFKVEKDAPTTWADAGMENPLHSQQRGR